MINNNDMQQSSYNTQEDDSFFNIDLKKLLNDVLKFWWLFLITIILAFLIVNVYHRFKKPVYSADLTLIIDADATSQTSLQNSQNSLIGGIMLSPMMRNLDNQVEILSSLSMTERVVNSLNIYVSYYSIGRVRESETYKSSQFVVVFDSTHCQPLGAKMHVDPIDDEYFYLDVDAGKTALYIYSERKNGGEPIEEIHYRAKHKYGEPIITPWCAFSVNKRKEQSPDTRGYFVFNSPEILAQKFKSSTVVTKHQSRNNESSVLTISTTGTCTSKMLDYLNQTAYSFINDNLKQKNEVAENTIKFINEQLIFLGDTLYNIGSQLSTYRVEHGLEQDAKVKSSQIFEEIKRYDKEIEEQKIILAYYDYLEKYFNDDSVMHSVIAPAFYDTKSASIITQLNEIMKLSTERHTYEETYGRGENPVGKQLTAKLYIARNTLLNSINNHRAMINKHISDLNYEYEYATKELMKLPEAERVLLNIDRRYALNNDVFNFLMRKRSEAQIQKASNTPDHKILDKAKLNGIISPKVSFDFAIGLMAALALPLAFLIIRQLLDDKIRSEEDLEKLTRNKIIGRIPNNDKGDMLIFNAPRSYIAESIRRIRNKLSFYANDGKLSVLVSSTSPGEGKTFMSMNIASAFAISGKKTVLMGYDLRKPGLNKVVGIENQLGLSNYIIGDCEKKDIIVNIKQDFDVILSGDVPPNPAELIAQQRSIDLINELKQEYDVVVIDTPPLGVVGDALSIIPYVDAMVFVVRQDYTVKNLLSDTLQILWDEKIPNLCHVLNDVDSKDARYGYKYGHRYGYGYGYYGSRRKKEHSKGYYYDQDSQNHYYTE
ncbi:MAG: polysaccharide biosynthesis tyrosine autokinase [Bacteroidales bacterium]|jgi:capsular exopolysaccharide synthesis family protein|nr:polysaccharide biosynthesis tyrosine autokinase [Bacteroidales bacterium]